MSILACLLPLGRSKALTAFTTLNSLLSLASFTIVASLPSLCRFKSLATFTTVAIFTTLVPTVSAASQYNKFDRSEASVIFHTSPNFLSFAIDSSKLKRGVAQLKLTDPTLISLTKHLSPAYLRIGGNAADSLLFSRQPVNESTAINTTSYFTGDDWLALHKFARQTNTRLLFDLNVLYRTEESKDPLSIAPSRPLKRKAASQSNMKKGIGKTGVTVTQCGKPESGAKETPWDSGTFGGKMRQTESQWDSSNAADLLRFCEEQGLDNDWQLGNEPNAFHHQFNTSVSPRQLAADFNTLKSLLAEFPSQSRSLLIGPDITHPKLHSTIQDGRCVNQIQGPPPYCVELFPETYLDQFLSSGGRDAISGVGFHQYYVNHTADVAALLSPDTLDMLRYQISVVKDVVARNYPDHAQLPPVWLSETGSCVGGGKAGLTDTFAASFVWADKLGLAARLGVAVAVRQSLQFGQYALIDHDTLTPNPDWWLSVLYKRLVDPRVLDIFVPLSHPTLRLYAQCSPRNNITVFGVNIGSNVERLYFNEECDVNYYEINAASSDLRTKAITLNHNRRVLRLNPDGSLPDMEPVRVHVYHGESVPIMPYSVLFMEIVLAGDHVCNQH